MITENLLKRPVAVGGVYSYTLGKGHLNGLNIQAPFDSEVTIRLRRDNGTDILMQHIPFEMLCAKSNMEFGYNSAYQENIAKVFNQYQTLFSAIRSTNADLMVVWDEMNRNSGITNVDFQTAIDATNVLNIAFNDIASGWGDTAFPLGVPIARVDLGSIYLSDGDELDIELKVDGLGSYPENGDVVFSQFSENEDPYNIEKYTLLKDNNVTLFDVDIAFLKAPDGANLNELSFQIDVGDESMLATYDDLVNATLINTTLEGYVDKSKVLPLLYEAKSAILPDVRIRTSGLDSGFMSIFYVQNEIIEDKAEEHNIQNAEKELQKIEKLERKEPKKAETLKKSGLIPSASILRSRIREARKNVKR